MTPYRRTTSQRRRAGFVAASLGAAALLASACGSSGHTSTGSATTTASSSSAATGGPASTAAAGASASSSSSSGLAAAQALYNKLSTPATQIAPTAKLVKKAPTGEKIICMDGSTSSLGLEMCQQAQQAAKLLGWNVKILPNDGTLPGIQSAYAQALALHPSGILDNLDGQTYQSLLPQLNAAKAAKVPVTLGSLPLPGQTPTNGGSLPPPIVGGQGGTFVENLQVEALTSFIAVDSQCKGTIGYAAVESVPVLKYFDGLVTASLQNFCPNLKVQVINNPISDIGAAMNNRIVSALEKNPSITYISADTGSFIQGLAAAIRAAGLPQKVKIVGTNPVPADYSAIAAGTETAWPGLDATWYGWYGIDSLARYFSGSPLVTEGQAPSPVFILDKTTLAAEKSGGSGVDTANGIQTSTMVSQFASDWLVSP